MHGTLDHVNVQLLPMSSAQLFEGSQVDHDDKQ